MTRKAGWRNFCFVEKERAIEVFGRRGVGSSVGVDKVPMQNKHKDAVEDDTDFNIKVVKLDELNKPVNKN